VSRAPGRGSRIIFSGRTLSYDLGGESVTNGNEKGILLDQSEEKSPGDPEEGGGGTGEKSDDRLWEKKKKVTSVAGKKGRSSRGKRERTEKSNLFLSDSQGFRLNRESP